MYKKLLKIGDHIVAVTSPSTTVMDVFTGNFLSINSSTKVDLTILINDNYGVPFVDYNVEITKSHDSISYRRKDYFITVDSSYTNATILVHNELALKHALMNLYSSFIVHHNWGLLLHSSCVIDKGMAHIFSGHSGAGKSTAAKLSHPRDLLADEATIIKITPTNVTVFDSPFRSELNGKCLTEQYRLDTIHLLNQSLLNKREKLTKSTSLLQLMDKVFYWTDSPKETKQIFHLLHTLVNQVPIYSLYFQKNNTFWEMIS